MKWKSKETKDVRYVKRFALFPIEAGTERRWLEWCWVLQELGVTLWHNICFADWKKKGSKHGWEIRATKSVALVNYAECTLCGHIESFSMHTHPLPPVCPKCSWKE